MTPYLKNHGNGSNLMHIKIFQIFLLMKNVFYVHYIIDKIESQGTKIQFCNEQFQAYLINRKTQTYFKIIFLY